MRSTELTITFSFFFSRKAYNIFIWSGGWHGETISGEDRFRDEHEIDRAGTGPARRREKRAGGLVVELHHYAAQKRFGK